MKTKLKTLTVKAFRGVRDTTLDFDSKSIILWGENGHGKSSLVDAFEFLFKGNISALEQARATSTKKHAPHIEFAPSDTSINIVIQNPDTTITRVFDGVTSSATSDPLFWQVGQETNFILKRQHLLDFVVAQPAGRYEQIAQIIGVSELDDVELNFKRRCDDLNQQVEDITYRQQNAQNDLMTLLGVEDLERENIISGVNRTLSQWGDWEIETEQDIDTVKLDVVRVSSEPEQVHRAAALSNVIELASQITEKKNSQVLLEALVTALRNLHQDTELIRTLIFRDVLQKSRDLIGEFSPEKCPVCEQAIDPDSLLERLDRRLELMAEAGRQSSIIAGHRGKFVGVIKELVEKLGTLAEEIANLQLEVNLTPARNYSAHLKSLVDEIEKSDLVRLDLSRLEAFEVAPELLAWEDFSQDIDQLLREELDLLGVSDRDEQVVQAIDFLSDVQEFLRRIEILNHQCQAKIWTRDQFLFAYDTFVETKLREIQLIYDDLQNDMNHYYDILHPGEHHRDIKIKVDTRKRGSAEIKMGYYDRNDEDPRAYQSEAHLDTLGLCAFLAFVKHFNKGFPLVILDDVVSTVDTQHRRRVCELLYSEFSDYQLFITTHDNIWLEELANYQRAYKISHKFSNIRILDWSKTEGLRLDRYRTRWEVLEDALSRVDKVGAGAHGRRNLEWLLLQMAINTETRIPINLSNRYQVSDLYEPFKSRFRKLVPDKFAEHEKIFIQFEADFIGNLLIHNNEGMENASMAEVRAFVQAVRALYDLFTCENDQFVQYHRGAKIMKCRCGHITWNTK